MNEVLTTKGRSTFWRAACFWIPAYALAILATALLRRGVFNDRVHWTESLAWASTYPLLSFALGYWAVKLINRDTHPGWRALAGLGIFALQLANGMRF